MIDDKKNKKDDLHFFLFNDILVITKIMSKSQYKYRSQIDLQYGAVQLRFFEGINYRAIQL